MVPTKTKKQIEIEVKKLVIAATFLKEDAKKEWLDLLASANLKELAEIKAFFVKAAKAQELNKLKIIHEANLDDQYLDEVKKISDSYVKKAIKSHEKHNEESKESPEDILKKLDSA